MPMIPTDGRVVSARGPLADFTAAGILGAADVHTARMLMRTGGETDQSVGLAVALTVRALRAGSVCLPIDQAREMSHFFVHDEADASITNVDDLNWPDPLDWLATIQESRLVAGEEGRANERPLRCVDSALYLERYWCDQESIRRILVDRCASPIAVDEAMLATSLSRLFHGDPREADQRRAVAAAVRGATTVIAGGPGTGKTHTISRVLEAMRDQWAASPDKGRIALAAPTGKAAARLTESLQHSDTELHGGESPSIPSTPTSAAAPAEGLHAVTLHRLLGARPGRGVDFGVDRRLPYDLIVVDEMSMVSLSLMARLLEALAPHTRLVMVGDPDQLTPVDAGAVLADITAAGLPGPDPEGGAIVELRHGFRFDTAIANLADAVRRGDAARVLDLLDHADAGIEFEERDPAGAQITDFATLRAELIDQARAMGDAAGRGDGPAAVAALERHRLLCAHRTGPYGVAHWSDLVHQVQRPLLGTQPSADADWYPGKPLLATQNLRSLGISNGDTGVVVSTGRGVRAAMSSGRSYEPFALQGVETMFAMTVHKSQGSQFDWLTLVLPSPDSPLLTRELLYTALTRARHGVRIIGERAAVEQAVRTPARRASGLTQRLHATLTKAV